MAALLSLEEAQNRIFDLVDPRPVITLPVDRCIGRYLAEDLRANRTQPPADLSAMDGYAINGDGPWQLVGESRAGHPFATLIGTGECVRISTGASMPEGADRVLIQENAEVERGLVKCTHDHPDKGKHVRRRGFDFAVGDTVLTAGVRIGPAQLALAIGSGHAKLPVMQPLRVGVLDSGDELSANPEDCGPDQIPASNGAMISAMLKELGCEIVRIGPVVDDPGALAEALAGAVGFDMLVTSGGASVGDHDLMRPALETWGASIDFWKVAIKPGKPLMVARREKTVIFGLPGNPVSSFVTCLLFVMPYARAAMGAATPMPPKALAKLGCDLAPTGSRREFLRGYWDGTTVVTSDSQDSSALAALAASNCLIDRPAENAALATGSRVQCILL